MWHRSRTGLLAAAALATVLLGGCAGAPAEDPAATTSTSSSPPLPAAQPTPDPPTFTRTPPPDTTGPATPRQLRGLVRIVATIGTDGRGETATGMLLRADGLAVTNNHAVSGATAVRATVMSSGRTYVARVVANDVQHDVALVQLVGAKALPTVTLAPREAEVGARVAVVGDAKGLVGAFTAATGTVRSLDITLVTRRTSTKRGETLTGLMLSTADVVLGVSGGPTYDDRGRVVGMTTAAVPRAHGVDGVAIPVDALREAVGGLLRRTTS